MDNKVTIKVLFFAKSRELSGFTESTIEVERIIQCEKLLDFLCDHYQLNIIKDNLILALNGDYCDNLETILTLGCTDEIAIIPPISGG